MPLNTFPQPGKMISARGGGALLSGEYRHNLDAKGRIIMPTKLREELGDTFYVMQGFEGCLAVRSVEGFETISNSVNALPAVSREARRMQRVMNASACQCEADKQGRFVIPPQLRAFAKLEKEVVIVGVGDRAEIWDKDKWEDYLYGEGSVSLEDVADALAAQGLSM